MKVLIVGLGRSNEDARRYLEARGDEIFTCDDRREADYNYRRLKAELPIFDLAIVAPGIRYNSALYRLVSLLALEVTGELELAIAQVKGKVPLVGITGTNGKTSTALMLTYLLRQAGYKVWLVGNIGAPLLGLAMAVDSCDLIVIEISSFQAQMIKCAELDLLICTSIAPNHLDSYDSLSEYYAAKKRLFRQAKKVLTTRGAALELHLEDGEAIKVDERGHDPARLDFLLALKAFFLLGQDPRPYLSLDYQKLIPSSRYHLFARYRALFFIDDSKATSLAAVKSALEREKVATVLILGGHLKSTLPQPLKADRILIYGPEARRFLPYAKGDIFADLAAVVRELKKSVDPDKPQRILFSPGGSSLLYPNYKTRGEDFCQLIEVNYESSD